MGRSKSPCEVTCSLRVNDCELKTTRRLTVKCKLKTTSPRRWAGAARGFGWQLQPQPGLRTRAVAEDVDRLTHSLRVQREHARHAERRVVGRDERSRGAGRKILVVGRVLDHLRRYEKLGEAGDVSELAVVGIELRIDSETPIVRGDLALRRRAPNAGEDQFFLGVDLVGDWRRGLLFVDASTGLKLAPWTRRMDRDGG